MSDSKFIVGEIVKFSKPANVYESHFRFKVLEIAPAQEVVDGKPEHGMLKEKLTVEIICGMYVKPIVTYSSEEFQKI